MKSLGTRSRRAIIGAVVVAALGCAVGLVNNRLSPKSIPLVGLWKKAHGVPSPGGEHDPTLLNKEITAEEAWRLYRDGIVFVDARTEEEYREGHIPEAISLPESQGPEGTAALAERLGRGRLVVIYCRSIECDEAHLLARALKEAGMENVVVFAGGIEGWEAAGYPVARGP